MKVARVFCSKTSQTPDDEDAFTGYPGLFERSKGYSKILINVVFTWDIPWAEKLAAAWKDIAPVEVGGPAIGSRGEEFSPGLFLKKGCVITSRGCPNRCWFCSVWKREGQQIRELPIVDGWIVQDDNLLSCSEDHVRNVFKMLERQPIRPTFSGGLEAAKLNRWNVELLRGSKPQQIFFAYDTPDDYEPLIEARKMLTEAGWSLSSHRVRAYVLIGHPKDSFALAEKRLLETIAAGYYPMAMLYRDKNGKTDPEWRKFQRLWARPAIISERLKQGA